VKSGIASCCREVNWCEAGVRCGLKRRETKAWVESGRHVTARVVVKAGDETIRVRQAYRGARRVVVKTGNGLTLGRSDVCWNGLNSGL